MERYPQQHAWEFDGPLPPPSQRRMPKCDITRPFGNAEEFAQTQPLESRPSLFGFMASRGGYGLDSESAGETRFEQIFREECKLRERELALAQERARMARDIKQRLSMLYDEEEESLSTTSSPLREPCSQRTDRQNNPDHVSGRSSELAGGMNCIGKYVSRSASASPIGVPYDVSLHSQDRKEPFFQAAMPPIMRLQPLHSPLPPDYTSSYMQHELQKLHRPMPEPWIARYHHNAAVQTEPLTEDPTGDRLLTIERDEVSKKKPHSSGCIEFSTPSFNLAAGSGMLSGTATRSASICSDYRGSSTPSQKAVLENQGGEHNRKTKEIEKTRLVTTPNEKSAAESKVTENQELKGREDNDAKHGAFGSACPQRPRVLHGGAAKGVVISPPLPSSIYTLPPSQSTYTHNMTLGNASAGTFPVSLESSPRGDGVQVQQQPPSAPSIPVAWCLPSSRVLRHSEFKNFLRGNWDSTPASMRLPDPPAGNLVEIPFETPADWSPARTCTLECPSSRKSHEPTSSHLENHLVEFPPAPHVPPRSSDPVKRRDKCICACGGSRGLSCSFSNCFSFVKSKKRMKNDMNDLSS